MNNAFANMNPLEEMRAIKAAISLKHETATSYNDYLRKKYPGANRPMPPPRRRKTPSKGERHFAEM